MRNRYREGARARQAAKRRYACSAQNNASIEMKRRLYHLDFAMLYLGWCHQMHANNIADYSRRFRKHYGRLVLKTMRASSSCIHGADRLFRRGEFE